MSLWYVAHILMYVKRNHKTHGRIPVWENIVLIKADSEEAAFAKAQEIGKRGEGDDDGSFRWGGHPAEWVFAGVRKVTLCEDPEKRHGDGAEISYCEMEVDTEQSVWNLLDGKATTVRLNDLFSAKPSERAEPAAQKQNVKAAP
jgi:hypothetical protein